MLSLGTKKIFKKVRKFEFFRDRKLSIVFRNGCKFYDLTVLILK